MAGNPPDDSISIRGVVVRLSAAGTRLVPLERSEAELLDGAEMAGVSDAFRYMQFRLAQVAPTHATVLLLGETGTGKGLAAETIHRLSPRRAARLVSVDCTALPATLIESELFGRERGAFTDARATQIGRFELADGGTIFLDEIGELPAEAQAKLLRVLQQGHFERLGSPRTIKVDVRVIAATNRTLSEEVRAGRFRRDLYYRLSVFPITMPPLRDRHGGRAGAGRPSRPAPGGTASAGHRRDPSGGPGSALRLRLAWQRARARKRARTRRHHHGRSHAAPRRAAVAADDRDRPVRRARRAGRRRARAHRPDPAGAGLAHRRDTRRGDGARPQAEHAAKPDAQAGHPPRGERPRARDSPRG